MDGRVKRLAVICARGGSKGIKGKNLRPLAGKPMLAHTVEQARDSGVFDWVAVSSDSDDILATGIRFGADFAIKRPAELASDTAAKIPAIRHCAAEVEAQVGTEIDIVTDLDATSPLRSLDDIRGAVAKLESSGADNLLTGMLSRRSPYFNLVEETADGCVELAKSLAQPIVRRQDAPKCFDLNASVFVWTRATLFSGSNSVFNARTILYEMPEERSIDVDTETDFEFVEFIMTRRSVGT